MPVRRLGDVAEPDPPLDREGARQLDAYHRPLRRLRRASQRLVIGLEDSLGGEAQGEVADHGGQASRAVAAMGLLLHPCHPCLAPLRVCGQRSVDGLGGEQLGQHEGVLDRQRRALRHVR